MRLRYSFAGTRGLLCLSEYLGTGTPIVTKITGGQIAKAIRNLTPGTAPGPDGFHAEHLRMILKAQNLEIG